MKRSLIVLALLASACGSAPEQAPVPPDVVQVRLTCSTGDQQAPCAFVPAEVRVRVGATVQWANDEATFHTVTSSARLEVRVPDGRFDAVLDAAGEIFSYTFTEPGTYPYYCQPHAEFMAGIVKVG